MEKSASEPVLRDDDYRLPSNGIGATGLAPRVLYGQSSKDPGKYSSRINQIIKQAEKVPGPGKYSPAYVDQPSVLTSKFSTGGRDYKSMHKNPAPTVYERKDFNLEPSNGAKDNLSNHYRVLHGKIPKGRKRSFTEQALKNSTPGPGSYKLPDRPLQGLKVTSWAKEMIKTKSSKQKVDGLAPNHYKIDYSRLSSEPCPLTYSVPKGKNNNFIDKFVREKWSDARTKKELPGPGTYPVQDFDHSRTSRGTMHLQLRGLTRAPISGYF